MKLKSRKCSFVATEILDSSLWEQWIQDASSLWHVQCLGSAGTCNYGKEWIGEEHTVKGMSLSTARSFTVCSVCMLSFHSNAAIVWTAIYDHKVVSPLHWDIWLSCINVINVSILEAGTSGSPRLWGYRWNCHVQRRESIWEGARGKKSCWTVS